jgi:hypothetical protein
MMAMLVCVDGIHMNTGMAIAVVLLNDLQYWGPLCFMFPANNVLLLAYGGLRSYGGLSST